MWKTMWRMLKTRWKQWRNAGYRLFKVLERCKKKKLCKQIKGTVKTLRKVFAIEKGKKRKLSTFPQSGCKTFPQRFCWKRLRLFLACRSFIILYLAAALFACCFAGKAAEKDTESNFIGTAFSYPHMGNFML